MVFDPIEVRAGGSVLIAARIEAVFKFISNPDTRLDAASPLEVHIETQGESVLDSRYQGELKIAGRVLRYDARTSVHEPPTLLVVEMKGDVSGEQVFNLAEEANATRLNLNLQYSVPPELPSYYREEPTRTRFAETLVSQTLANIRAALEKE
ncbi:MAG: SRPBCC family protein [Chloroflexi bacterium]|nr:SRPBCC family protein [Chloroflexota bacterium]